MNQDSKQYQRLYYLDLKCLDTLATLIQEEQTSPNPSRSSQSATKSASSLTSSHEALTSPKSSVVDKVKNPETRNARANSGRSLVGTSEGKRARSATTNSVLGLSSARASSPSDSDPAHNMTAEEIRKICPILAALSKEIEGFFKEVPETLDILQRETNISIPSPFHSFQKECESFLSWNFTKDASFSAKQDSVWIEIRALLRIIIDFPKAPLDIEPNQSLINLIGVTDRLLKNCPRYANQTAEMPSKGKNFSLSKVEVLAFMERIAKQNSAYLKHLQESSTSAKDPLVQTHLETLIEISQARMDGQSYQMTKQKEDQIRVGIIGDLFEKGEKSRMVNQEWVSPQIQKEADIDVISRLAAKADPGFSEKQRFQTSESKQKEIYMAKVEGVLERTPRLLDQQSLPKSELMENRLSPLLSCLENMPQRFDNQAADSPAAKRRNTTPAKDPSQNTTTSSPKIESRNSVNRLKGLISGRASTIQEGRRSSATSPSPVNARRRSSISSVVKGIARRASAAFRPKDSDTSVIEDVQNEKEISNITTSKSKLANTGSTDILSLEVVLSSGPKKTKTVVEGPSKVVTVESLPTKGNSKSSEQINGSNQGGFMGKFKALLKPSSSNKDFNDNSNASMDITNSLQQQSSRKIPGSTGSIKALLNSLTVKKGHSGGDLSTKSTKQKSASREIPKSTSGECLQNTDTCPPKDKGLDRKEREEIPTVPIPAVPQTKESDSSSSVSKLERPIQMLPLKTENVSTETIELKSPEERTRISIAPIGHIDSGVAANTGNKRQSKLRTSVNQEDMEKLNQRSLFINAPQSKRASVNKVTPSVNGGVAFMNLKTINGSGSTLPDLDGNRPTDGIKEEGPITAQDPIIGGEVKSEPATREPTSRKAPSNSVLSATAAMESKIHSALYDGSISNSLDSNTSS